MVVLVRSVRTSLGYRDVGVKAAHNIRVQRLIDHAAGRMMANEPFPMVHDLDLLSSSSNHSVFVLLLFLCLQTWMIERILEHSPQMY